MPHDRVEPLPTHTPALFAASVAQAAAWLRAGEVVALPTETVYGLAANALDPVAVARIFALKGRPAENPLIVHVASQRMAHACAAAWPPLADPLANAFWPGPLTLVVPKASSIPDLVTAGGPTVGVRWPQHPFIQAVIRACDFPLAAPSANPSNQLSPTCAAHVISAFGSRLPRVVDGGDANVGLESTVVDVTGPVPRLLRPGMIDALALARAVGLAVETGPVSSPSATPLRSPGLLTKHYSPRARLIVRPWRDEADLQAQLAKIPTPRDRIWILAHTNVPLGGDFPHVCVVPDDPEAYARALYGELHRYDAAGASLIVVEAPPSGTAWAAVADRLRRAEA